MSTTRATAVARETRNLTICRTLGKPCRTNSSMIFPFLRQRGGGDARNAAAMGSQTAGAWVRLDGFFLRQYIMGFRFMVTEQRSLRGVPWAQIEEFSVDLLSPLAIIMWKERMVRLVSSVEQGLRRTDGEQRSDDCRVHDSSHVTPSQASRTGRRMGNLTFQTRS